MIKPYIPITKLAEYTAAKPLRRRQIIKSLKDDKDFHRNYYQTVRTILLKYFKSNYDEAILDNAITKINKMELTTSWDISDKKNSLLAIECLRDSSFPDLTDYDFIEHSQKLDNIILANVKVTLKPEIYLTHRKTKKLGAVKFNLSKTEANRLGESELENAATGLKYGLIDLGNDIKMIDTKACITVDIFNKIYANSPASYKQTINTLTCSCEEIAVRWDTI